MQENSKNIINQRFKISDKDRSALMGHAPCVLWFTGISGAGKSTVAGLVDARLHSLGFHTVVLDGDNVRQGLNRDLGFSAADRAENIRRVAEVARLMMNAGLIVLVALISPFAGDRRLARNIFPPQNFFEIFVDTPVEVCIQRDPKGLYQRSFRGEIPEMTSVSSPYERPERPELVLNGACESPEKLADKVMVMLERQGFFKKTRAFSGSNPVLPL